MNRIKTQIYVSRQTFHNELLHFFLRKIEKHNKKQRNKKTHTANIPRRKKIIESLKLSKQGDSDENEKPKKKGK